ncbi:MAG: UDP-N-acetylmuramoyl-L-alanine--D-glutamate ligase [Oscillospiraceae bacterium]|nr:UDP-N-acetylmuramoyl-L-alanine--D-glutamate ligase [Oscillospiraceae bacterium]
MSQLRNWFSTLRGSRVGFLGWGKSNAGLVELAAECGALTQLRDRKDESRFSPELINKLKDLGVELILGENYLEGLEALDLVFRTPGIDWNKPEIQKAVNAGVEFTSEIEKFFDLCPCRTIGVTGSDGKTTTTTLISKMVAESGKKVHLGGNIGDTLLQRLDQIGPNDIVVVELSSFQLISMRRSPNVAVVTNLTPNHLDHHKDLAEYYGAKKNILRFQGPDDVAVLFDNDTVREEMLPCVRGKLRYFGDSELEDGSFFDDECIYKVIHGKKTEVIPQNDLVLLGRHNRFNACAAVAASMDDCSEKDQRAVLSTFGGVEHRIEFTRELDGVRYYNDSIATSPTRTIAGLKAFPKKIILIAGGYDKNLSYDGLAPVIREKVKKLVLTGPTAKKIRDAVLACTEFETPEIESVPDLKAAVEWAKNNSESGDVVMLSPASASFDAFVNFEERGKYFKELVRNL